MSYLRRLFAPCILAVSFTIVLSKEAMAYIDPGTGSLVFQMLLAALLSALFAVKIFWKRIKSFLGRILGRSQATETDEK